MSGIRELVIVGDGAVGASVAAAVALSLRGSDLRVTALRSGSGDGMAETVAGGPHSFHRLFGIDETMLLTRARAAPGLGTRVVGSASDDAGIFLPLGTHGRPLRLVDFHQYALKFGFAGAYNEYSLAAVAAQRGRMHRGGIADEELADTFAFEHYVDPEGYAVTWREAAERAGARMPCGEVAAVDIKDGLVRALVLNDGARLTGDFFIDCTPERCVADRLGTEFNDWSHWLPADCELSTASHGSGEPWSFAEIRPWNAGWRRKLSTAAATVDSVVCPNRNAADAERAVRAGNGYRRSRWRSGRYLSPWTGNCVALGPAAMGIEPLFVTPLQRAQAECLRLLGMLPDRRRCPELAREYNRVTAGEHRGIRDFHLLIRYLSGAGPSGPEPQLPESLRRRIALFRSHGRITEGDREWFGKDRWVSAFFNFGCLPEIWDPLADMPDESRIRDELDRLRERIRRTAESMG